LIVIGQRAIFKERGRHLIFSIGSDENRRVAKDAADALLDCITADYLRREGRL
tara:strand:- start:2552 stop:2710 length:159 start_codon:yes stop_codon:yes gene_type:complete